MNRRGRCIFAGLVLLYVWCCKDGSAQITGGGSGANAGCTFSTSVVAQTSVAIGHAVHGCGTTALNAFGYSGTTVTWPTVDNAGCPSACTGDLTLTFSPAFTGAVVIMGATGATYTPGLPQLISTSGPVADPGGIRYQQYNNASGALTFNAPAAVVGMLRCYRNATGKSGAITIQMATGNKVTLAGTDGSSAGTLVSSGALDDAVCLTSDATNHWYAWVAAGTWTNN